jgi:hypothetical protein
MDFGAEESAYENRIGPRGITVIHSLKDIIII